MAALDALLECLVEGAEVGALATQPVLAAAGGLGMYCPSASTAEVMTRGYRRTIGGRAARTSRSIAGHRPAGDPHVLPGQVAQARPLGQRHHRHQAPPATPDQGHQTLRGSSPGCTATALARRPSGSGSGGLRNYHPPSSEGTFRVDTPARTPICTVDRGTGRDPRADSAPTPGRLPLASATHPYGIKTARRYGGCPHRAQPCAASARGRLSWSAVRCPAVACRSISASACAFCSWLSALLV